MAITAASIFGGSEHYTSGVNVVFGWSRKRRIVSVIPTANIDVTLPDPSPAVTPHLPEGARVFVIFNFGQFAMTLKDPTAFMADTIIAPGRAARVHRLRESDTVYRWANDIGDIFGATAVDTIYHAPAVLELGVPVMNVSTNPLIAHSPAVVSLGVPVPGIDVAAAPQTISHNPAVVDLGVPALDDINIPDVISHDPAVVNLHVPPPTIDAGIMFVGDDGSRTSTPPTGRQTPCVFTVDIYDAPISGDWRKAKVEWDFGDGSATATVTDPDTLSSGLGKRTGLRNLNSEQRGFVASYVYDGPDAGFTIVCNVTEEDGTLRTFFKSVNVKDENTAATPRTVRYFDPAAIGLNNGLTEIDAWTSEATALAAVSSDFELRIQNGALFQWSSAEAHSGVTNVLFRSIDAMDTDPTIQLADTAFTALTLDATCSRWGFLDINFDSLGSFTTGNRADFLVSNGASDIWIKGGNLRGETGSAHGATRPLTSVGRFMTLNTGTTGAAILGQERYSQTLNGVGAHIREYLVQATGSTNVSIVGAQLNSSNDTGHVLIKDGCRGVALQWVDIYSDPDVGGYNNGTAESIEIYSADFVSVNECVVNGSLRLGLNDGATPGKAADVVVDDCYIRKTDEIVGTEPVGALDINPGASRVLVRDTYLEARGAILDNVALGIASNPCAAVGSSGTTSPATAVSDVEFYNVAFLTASRSAADNPAHLPTFKLDLAGATYSNISLRNCVTAVPGTEMNAQAVDLIDAPPAMVLDWRNNLWPHQDRYVDFLDDGVTTYATFGAFDAAEDSANSAETGAGDPDTDSVLFKANGYQTVTALAETFGVPVQGVHSDYAGTYRDPMLATWPIGAVIPAVAQGDLFPFFEKTAGELDKMGVKVARTVGTQTVWAPGSAAQEYPGGWVTPGDYDLSIQQAKIHHHRDGRRPDQGGYTAPTLPFSVQDGTKSDGTARTYAINYRIVDDPITHAGFEWHAALGSYDLHNQGAAREIKDTGQTTDAAAVTVTLSAGDVLHVSYGRPIDEGGVRNNFAHHQGSDGFIVYCVAAAPEYRGGLYGTGQQTYDTTMWNTLVARISEAASLYEVDAQELTQKFYGPATLPVPIPDDWYNRGEVTDPANFSPPDDDLKKNNQCKWLSRFIANRAMDTLKNGAGAQGSFADLETMVEFALNNPQPCFYFSESTWNYCHHGIGFDPWPPFQASQFQAILAGAVAVGKTPEYEPLHRWLTYFAQLTDSMLPLEDSYLYANANNVTAADAYSGANNGYTGEEPNEPSKPFYRRHAYVNWIMERSGHTDMQDDRDRQMAPWAIGLWARRLFGMADTPIMTDMLTKQGWNDATDSKGAGNISQHGHPYSDAGATGWDNPHTKHNVSAMHWLWFTDTERNRDMSRFCRRDPRYYDNPDFGTPGVGGIPAHHGLPSNFGKGQSTPFSIAEDLRQFYWSLWVQDRFVFDPTNLSATPNVTKVDLDWDDYSVTMANASSGQGYSQSRYDDFDHFVAYRATAAGGPYEVLDNTLTASTFSDTTGTPSTTYYYVVTAVDAAGNESAYSDEASAVFP